MRNTGESEMTILNACVKCSKLLINAIIKQQSTGEKVEGGTTSTRLQCHGPPDV